MATNDPFSNFRRRRGSLFDEFFSDFFDRPLGVEGATRPRGREPPRHPAAPVEHLETSPSSSRTPRGGGSALPQLALEWTSISTPNTCVGGDPGRPRRADRHQNTGIPPLSRRRSKTRRSAEGGRT